MSTTEWFAHGYLCGRALAGFDPERALYTQWQWEFWAAGNRTGQYDHNIADFNPKYSTHPMFDANPGLKRMALATARAMHMGFIDGHHDITTNNIKFPVMFNNLDLQRLWMDSYRVGWTTGVAMREQSLYIRKVVGLITPTPYTPQLAGPEGFSARQLRENEEWWRKATAEQIKKKLLDTGWDQQSMRYYDLWRTLSREKYTTFLGTELQKAERELAKHKRNGQLYLVPNDQEVIRLLNDQLGKE